MFSIYWASGLAGIAWCWIILTLALERPWASDIRYVSVIRRTIKGLTVVTDSDTAEIKTRKVSKYIIGLLLALLPFAASQIQSPWIRVIALIVLTIIMFSWYLLADPTGQTIVEGTQYADQDTIKYSIVGDKHDYVPLIFGWILGITIGLVATFLTSKLPLSSWGLIGAINLITALGIVIVIVLTTARR